MNDYKGLHAFILAAKAATYIGDGPSVGSSQPGSHNLTYQAGPFEYLDSYFGGSDFIGEEIVFEHNAPVWGMNYYGYILKPGQISAAEVGALLKISLARMYAEGRFLGGWRHQQDGLLYIDTSQGDWTRFSGREWVEQDGETVYELLYHGGLIS